MASQSSSRTSKFSYKAISEGGDLYELPETPKNREFSTEEVQTKIFENYNLPKPPRSKQGVEPIKKDDIDPKELHVPPKRRNLYLDYNWTPLTEEAANVAIPRRNIEGHVPHDLRGRLYRIGPNARYLPGDDQRINWFDGDGMIHAVAFENDEDGRMRASYSNRWVQSSFYKQELCIQRPSLNITSLRGIHGILLIIQELLRLFVQSFLLGFKYTRDRIDSFSPLGVANTNMLFRKGSIYALYESDGPWKLNPVSLTTEGFNDRDLRPQGVSEPYCAHPKAAVNGDLISFGILFRPGPMGGMILYVNNPEDPSRERKFKVPDMESYIHDICISKDFIIFMDSPCRNDLSNMLYGGGPLRWDYNGSFMDSPCRNDLSNMLYGGGPLRWDYNGSSRIGVIPRDEHGMKLLGLETLSSVKWFKLEEEESGFVFHWGNGFNDDQTIIACGSYFEEFDISFLDEEIPMNYDRLPKMSDFRIDLESGRVCRHDILRDDNTKLHTLSDFPVWSQTLTGGEHRTRFLYGSFAFLEANRTFVGPRDEVPTDGTLTTIGGFAGYFKYDLTDPDAPRIKRIAFPRDVNGGECCFVLKAGAVDEDDGYLIGIVTHLPRDPVHHGIYANSYRSYVWVFDAKLSDIEDFAKFDKSDPYHERQTPGSSTANMWVGRVPGLLASIELPNRVPWGLHNLFLPNDELF
eukprot:CAMPEP_0184688746 /NCGR_PEP_ID=MMETSP0312-20130426/30264_1 /TAXON_ID=31354 /ORGANISM="Compsopogon coeruleus, Strain SAG 36.94" /LENGTH=689 /DNA_ID=CAMNT_0027146009 /DNA_START=515 /DNA_END=2585 /DNA_ORIENTATION=+